MSAFASEESGVLQHVFPDHRRLQAGRILFPFCRCPGNTRDNDNDDDKRSAIRPAGSNFFCLEDAPVPSSGHRRYLVPFLVDTCRFHLDSTMYPSNRTNRRNEVTKMDKLNHERDERSAVLAPVARRCRFLYRTLQMALETDLVGHASLTMREELPSGFVRFVDCLRLLLTPDVANNGESDTSWIGETANYARAG